MAKLGTANGLAVYDLPDIEHKWFKVWKTESEKWL